MGIRELMGDGDLISLEFEREFRVGDELLCQPSVLIVRAQAFCPVFRETIYGETYIDGEFYCESDDRESLITAAQKRIRSKLADRVADRIVRQSSELQ